MSDPDPLQHQLSDLSASDPSDFLRSVRIFIVNHNEELLCHLRGPALNTLPAFWDLGIGGIPEEGEPGLQAAVRETAEQLGLLVRPDQFRPLPRLYSGRMEQAGGEADFLLRTHLAATDFTFSDDQITALEYFGLDYVRYHLKAQVPALRFIPLKKRHLRLLDQIEITLSRTEAI